MVFTYFFGGHYLLRRRHGPQDVFAGRIQTKFHSLISFHDQMQRTFREGTQLEAIDADEVARHYRLFSERRDDLTWEQVLQFRRVLLVAEAGAGKTYECEQRAKLMFNRGEAAFHLRLENVPTHGVVGLMRKKQKQRFKTWQASSELGYFFLDSIDELQLVHGSFRAALERLADDLDGALGRAVIVVTSRPVEIDRQAFTEILPVPVPRSQTISDGGEFVSIAMRDQPAAKDNGKPSDQFKELTLLPLSTQQVVEFAREYMVTSPEKLLHEIQVRNAHEFARWPQELIELFDDWKKHGEIRPHHKQVESHVQVRLKARADRREKADVSLNKARQGAQRLGLAVMLCRRWTFRYSAGADVAGSSEHPIDPATLLQDWSAPEIAALLERPLFGDGGYGRVRFRHRSVIEYLAACQLHHQIESGMLSLSAAKRVLLGLTDTNERVSKPSLRPIAAWLALLRQDIFEAMLKVDPSTLLIHGDPESLNASQCAQALSAFVNLHGKGRWRDLNVPNLQVSRLAKQPLGNTVLELWNVGIENPEIRQLLLQLISRGSYAQCADLAASIASDQNAEDLERLEGLVALTNLSDDRADGFIEAAMSVAEGWTQSLARWVGTYLYPEHVTDGQLLKLIEKLVHAPGDDTHFADNIARVIASADLNIERLRGLLPKLTELTREMVALDHDEDKVIEPTGRFRVSRVLRAVCIRLLILGDISGDLLNAAVIAFRVARSSHDPHGENADLGKQFLNLLEPHRRKIFDADYAWVIERYSDRTARSIYARLVFLDAPLHYSRKTDQSWIMEALGETSRTTDYRAVVLHLAVHLSPLKDGKVTGIKAVRRTVADSPALVEKLDELIAAATHPGPEIVRMQREQRERQKQRKRKLVKDREQWHEVWRLLAKKPTQALAPDRLKNTIWNISLALRNKPRPEGDARWDRALLERNFGKVATDLLREGLMTYWRSLRPTVRSEREAGDKDTYLTVWLNALMGLYAEAENAAWATKLNVDEAELAARYALLEPNGSPSWLLALSQEHPTIVERVIGDEIEADLSETSGTNQWHSMRLQALRHGHSETAKLFEQRLIEWLKRAKGLMRQPHTTEAENKLDQVIRVLLAHGSEKALRWLGEIATREVRLAKNGPYLLFWLRVLCQIDPHRGLTVLLGLLDRLPVEKDGWAVQVIGRLFDERSNPGMGNWRTTLAPFDMLRLVKAVHRHILSEHDEVHQSVYTPGSRDHAEDGRRYVFHELMASTGPDAITAKLALASDPEFAYARDHISQLARERLAAEIDASVFSPNDVAKTLKGSELTPQTGSDMAELLVDRLDDLQDLMLRDTAPRAAWAMVTDENALRPAIAREFEVSSHGAYTVDQEAVTADGKETDIRLRALADLQATIELKIGDKPRSGRELRDTIEDQLISKYMAHSKARTGCLLVTVKNPDKRWDHPDTGASLDRQGLQEMLSEAAQRAQQRLAGDARVLARVLDLTPRLPTEAKARLKITGARRSSV